jgi:hypothetical protein
VAPVVSVIGAGVGVPWPGRLRGDPMVGVIEAGDDPVADLEAVLLQRLRSIS